MSDCCPEFPRIRVRNGDGSFTDLPVVDNIITLPGAVGETPFAAFAGCGIEITEGGEAGHSPTFSIAIDDDTAIPVVCTDDGIRVGPAPTSPRWTSPNETKTGGIRVIPGGDLGHAPTFQIALGPNTPFGIQDGCLVWTGGEFGAPFTCADLAGCSINALSGVDIAGPGVVVASDTGGVSTTPFCDLLVECLPEADGVLLLDAGALVSKPKSELVAECLGLPTATTTPAAPAGAGPWVIQYDGTQMTWVEVV